MEILFCDICNESVPQADLARGRAVQRGERVVCASCETAMGGVRAGAPLAAAVGPATHTRGTVAMELGLGPSRMQETVPGRAAASGSGAAPSGTAAAAALALGLVAVAVAGTGTWLAVERVQGLERAHAAELTDLRGELASARREQASARTELAGEVTQVRQDVRGVAAGVADAIAAGDEAVSRELVARDEAIASVRKELEEARGREAALAQELRAVREGEDKRVASLQIDVRTVGDRLTAVEENLRTVGVRTPAAGAPSGAVAAGPAAPAAPTAPSWERYLADLSSPDDALRVDAVIALGETRDRQVVPHVLPMLKDGNLWVRMVAAEALGKLGDPSAVPALIATLEDERSAVRGEALSALQRLTGETLRFDIDGSDSERAKRVREWRDWWAKNRDRLLAATG